MLRRSLGAPAVVGVGGRPDAEAVRTSGCAEALPLPLPLPERRPRPVEASRPCRVDHGRARVGPRAVSHEEEKP